MRLLTIAFAFITTSFASFLMRCTIVNSQEIVEGTIKNITLDDQDTQLIGQVEEQRQTITDCNSLANNQEGVNVTIEDIISDDQITGQATGLTPEGKECSKIVLYVKTDQWYIHPYVQGGEGKSYAVIEDDNSWDIETVSRGFDSSSVAALVVKKDSEIPSRTQNVRNIPNLAITVVNLDENHHWHGKI